MGRPKTIRFTEAEILGGIASYHEWCIADCEAESKRYADAYNADRQRHELWRQHNDCERYLATTLRKWCPYDLEQFVRRELTDSEKVTLRRRIRELAAAGLLELDGRRTKAVRITDKGMEALRADDHEI